MNTTTSLHAAGAPSTDAFAIYDQLPPLQPPTIWRRVFPTLAQMATSLRHHDHHAAA